MEREIFTCPVCGLTYANGEERIHEKEHNYYLQLIKQFGFLPDYELRERLKRFLWEIVYNEKEALPIRVQAALAILWMHYSRDVQACYSSFLKTPYREDFLSYVKLWLSAENCQRANNFPDKIRRVLATEFWIEDLIVKEFKEIITEVLLIPSNANEVYVTNFFFSIIAKRLYVMEKKKKEKLAQVLIDRGLLKKSNNRRKGKYLLSDKRIIEKAKITTITVAR